ncbi:MAG: hypothetical protein A2V67_15075 [Deltaproteobacteria bacterium RBG_13_61_14]|nr:MAG: hypothetical protein A2V67_15075 [Deltaproteobacteria bacterium RBG_13_61_14]
MVGMKEVWGASQPSYRAWYWEIQTGLDALIPYCVSKGSITLIDENGQELEYLPESTEAEQHYFYVKMETPINRLQIPPRPVTSNIEGQLLSYDAEGNVLDSLTVNLVYGNYSSSYHRSGKIEVIYGLSDSPWVLDALTIDGQQGGIVVATAKGGGSFGLAIGLGITVGAVSFNWNDSDDSDDAITVKDRNLAVIQAPEWSPGAGVNYPVAYLRGVSPVIKAHLFANPNDFSGTIPMWVQSQKCNVYSRESCFPYFEEIPVSFSGGEAEAYFSTTATFPADKILAFEDGLGFRINPEGLGPYAMAALFPKFTGPHSISVIYDVPQPPNDAGPVAEVVEAGAKMAVWWQTRYWDMPMLGDPAYIANFVSACVARSCWNNSQFAMAYRSFPWKANLEYYGGQVPYTSWSPRADNLTFYLTRLLKELSDPAQKTSRLDCQAFSNLNVNLITSLGIPMNSYALYHPNWVPNLGPLIQTYPLLAATKSFWEHYINPWDLIYCDSGYEADYPSFPNLYDAASWQFHMYPLLDLPMNPVYDSASIQVRGSGDDYFCPRGLWHSSYKSDTFETSTLAGNTVLTITNSNAP